MAIGVWSGVYACRAAEQRAITDIPPAAAKGAEQGRGIREALHVGLHLRERGTLVLLLGGEDLELCVLARAVLGGCQVLVRTRGLERTVVRRVAVGIVL